MNYYYKALYLLRDTFDSCQFVNTITQGLNKVIDDKKKNIYPLVHINILSASLPKGEANFRFEVMVMDVRKESTEPITDKFRGNDNEIDNLNTAHAIINEAVTKLRLSHDDFTFEVGELLPALMAHTNALDGWRVEIEIGFGNNELDICYND